MEFLDNVTLTYNNVTSGGTQVSMASLLLSIVRLLTGLMILTLNSITVAAFVTVERLRTRGNMLVVSLAVTDLIVGLVLQFDFLNWAPGISTLISTSKAWCVFRMSALYVTCVASILSIVGIAVERYLYIVQPYFYQRFVTPGFLAVIIVITWAAALLYGTVPIYVNRFSQVQICDNIEAFSSWHAVYGACTIILTASIVTGLLYTLIFRLAMQKLKQIVPLGQTSQGAFRSQLQASKQSVVVALIFVVCWGPHFIASALHVINPIPFRTRAIISSLGMFNSACNFFIYVVFNPFFRRTVKTWARKCWGFVFCRNMEDIVAGGNSEGTTQLSVVGEGRTGRNAADAEDAGPRVIM